MTTQSESARKALYRSGGRIFNLDKSCWLHAQDLAFGVGPRQPVPWSTGT